MKKFLFGFGVLALATVLMSSCKVHKGCEAYSKVEVKKSATRV